MTWLFTPIRRRLMRWRPLRKSTGHDVSSEPRDEDGKWKRGGPPAPFDAKGRPLVTAEQIARSRAIQSHPIVPRTAWGVEFPDDPNGRVAVTWYDAKGTKQSGYTAMGVAHRNNKKYGKIPHFEKIEKAMLAQVMRDLKLPDASKDRVCAAIVAIIHQTGMRVGSERYAKDNDTFGASSLRKSHVTIKEDRIEMAFVGKHNKAHIKVAKGKDLVGAVKHLLTLPGDRLFQCHTSTGALRAVTERDVNAWLDRYKVTAKDFRTCLGTRMCRNVLQEMGPPANETQCRKNIAAAVQATSAFLGNTPGMARDSYIDPVVLEDYAAQLKGGTMSKSMRRKDDDGFWEHYRRMLANIESGRYKGVDPYPEDLLASILQEAKERNLTPEQVQALMDGDDDYDQPRPAPRETKRDGEPAGRPRRRLAIRRSSWRRDGDGHGSD